MLKFRILFVMNVQKIIKKVIRLKIEVSSLQRAVEMLERGIFQRVEFDVKIGNVRNYKAKMYKVGSQLIRIDLRRVGGDENKA